MTVSTTTIRVTYAGDGVTVAFPVTFPFFATSDLQVIERAVASGAETPKAEGTHYTVAGGAGDTGTVTALVAPSSAVQWIIRRATPALQSISYPPNDAFPAKTHEGGLDRATMRDQEFAELLGRALVFPPTDPTSLVPVLPASIDRANKYLKFDASGNPVAATDVAIGVLTLPVGIADGGTGTTSAAAARTALAVAGLADNNTLSGTNVFTATPTVRSTETGVDGANFNLQHDSPTPEVNDVVGSLNFIADDDGGAPDTIAQLRALYTGVAAGAESATLELRTIQAGTRSTRVNVGAGLYMQGVTGADKGGGTGNFVAVYQQGVAVALQQSYAKLSESLASGTNGGSTVATAWTKMPLNTEVDPAGVVTFDGANDWFDLGAGTYEIEGYASFNNNAGEPKLKIRLQNTTDASTAVLGSNIAKLTNAVDGICHIRGRFTIAATKRFEWQYWSSTAETNTGLGRPASTGSNEIYRELEIRKVG